MYLATKTLPKIVLVFAQGLSYGLSKSQKLDKIVTKL